MDINNLGTLTTSDTVSGTVNPNLEPHFFRINVIAGAFYQINVNGADSILAAIYDADNNKKLSDINLTDISFIAPESSSYIIEVAAKDDKSGIYELSMESANTLNIEVPISETVASSNDKDLYKIELTEGTRYNIKLAGAGSILSAIYDENAQKIGDLNITEWAGNSPITGTFYLEVSAQEGVENTIDYTLSITEPEDDYSADKETSGLLGSQQVSGFIGNLTDKDWFQVDLRNGANYSIKLADTSMAKFSAVYNADGNRMTELSGKDLTFNSSVTGSYYIEVAADEQIVGDYSISMTAELNLTNIDYHQQNRENAQNIGISTPQTGLIENKGEQDWFKLNIEPDKTYRINLISDDMDPIINGIYDADGNFIQGSSNDDGGNGFNAQLIATFDTNEYYLAVAAVKYDTGSYNLTIEETQSESALQIKATQQVEQPQNASILTIGTEVTGDITAKGEMDRFQVELLANKDYSISLTGTTLADPYLSGIYDGKGTIIAQTIDNDSGGNNNALLTFRPQMDGIYYIEASSWDAAKTGAYSILLTEIQKDPETPPIEPIISGDDYADNTGTTGIVIVGGEMMSGNISKVSPGEKTDKDWFKVTLESNQQYRIDLKTDINSENGISNPVLYGVYDNSGAPFIGKDFNNTGLDKNDQLIFTTVEAGEYYIVAGGTEGFFSNSGDYTLSIDTYEGTISIDQYSDDTQTTGVINVGSSIIGAIETINDADWFRVALQADAEYSFTLEGNPANINGIYNKNGRLIQENAGKTLSFQAPETDDYYISVKATGLELGDYTLRSMLDSAGETTIDIFSTDINTTGNITLGTPLKATLETAGDQDWFRVDLNQDIKYQIDLQGSQTSSGTLRDPFFKGIFDSTGKLLAGTENDDTPTGRNSQVILTIENTDTYYIAAGASDSGTGTYTLSIKEWEDSLQAGDDFLQSVGTTGIINVGEAKEAAIDYVLDEDWFEINLVAGKTYNIDLLGDYNNDTYTLVDPYLNGIYDSNGLLVTDATKDDNSGPGFSAHLAFTPDTSATYYIAATSFLAQTGTYRLSVTTDDYGASTSTAGSLSVGGKKQGNIETPNDIDWFSVSLNAKSNYRFDLMGDANQEDWIADPLIRGIYNRNGTLLQGTYNDDGGDGNNARVDFLAPTSDTYYIQVEARLNDVGTYELQLIPL